MTSRMCCDPFSALPTELCLRILQLVSPSLVATKIQYVSSRWRSLANDDSLWRHFCVSSSQMGPFGSGRYLEQSIQMLIKHFTELNELENPDLVTEPKDRLEYLISKQRAALVDSKHFDKHELLARDAHEDAADTTTSPFVVHSSPSDIIELLGILKYENWNDILEDGIILHSHAWDATRLLTRMLCTVLRNSPQVTDFIQVIQLPLNIQAPRQVESLSHLPDLSPLLLINDSNISNNSNVNINIGEYSVPGCYKRLYSDLQVISMMLKCCPVDLLQSGVACSSQDHDGQGIEQTLIYHDPDTFWSSRGNSDKLSSEWLVYKLGQVSVVGKVTVQPFKAHFQRGLPIYAPQYVRVRVGFTKDPYQMHFVSKAFPISNINTPQELDLAPHFVVGKYVMLELVGRHETQPGDELYYTVLQNVWVQGIPVEAINIFTHEGPLLSIISKLTRALTDEELDYSDSISIESFYQILWTRLRLMVRTVKSGFYVATQDLAAMHFDVRSDEGEILIRLIQSCTPAQPQLVLQYYLSHLQRADTLLTQFESKQIASMAANGDLSMSDVMKLISEERILFTEDIGDIFRQAGHLQLALEIYTRSNVIDKMLECYIILKQYMIAARILRITTPMTHLQPSSSNFFSPIIQQIHQENGTEDTISFALDCAELSSDNIEWLRMLLQALIEVSDSAAEEPLRDALSQVLSGSTMSPRETTKTAIRAWQELAIGTT